MCLFCKMVSNEIPTNKIYEDDYTLAFLDISPATPGHTLVIPKKHFTNIFEIDEENLQHINNTLLKIVKHYKEILDITDVNIINNSGVLAGQTVFHIHYHIIPRYNNEPIKEPLDVLQKKIKL